MIKFIFTIDYEIYGNGEGALRDLVYDPTEKLMALFQKWNVNFVTFVEVAELEMIEINSTDQTIDMVKNQIQDLHKKGFELGLHLHPQWYNGRYKKGKWILDYSEYNLCTLPRDRIVQIVERAIKYFQDTLGVADFVPFSFRAGNWLFQPTKPLACILADRSIRVDSSVFKGGLQRQHEMDYRRTLKNGYYWRFTGDVSEPTPQGRILELPIYTVMVRPWKMITKKRVDLHYKASLTAQHRKGKFYRFMDFLRLRHPLKLDFCRMTIDELTQMLDMVIKEDQEDPKSFRPIVAIGHTKDLVDFKTLESLLSYLMKKRIAISNFEEVYERCN